MSSLTPAQFSFLYRQQWLIMFGLGNVFYGAYAILVAFLVYFLRINKMKQTSYKVLMGLIVLMFVLQTIHNVCDWYIVWLAFIRYGNMPDQALDTLEVDGTASLTLRVIESMFGLLTTLRLAIADSIMVWRCWIICNRSWMAAIVPFVFNIASIALGITLFGLDVTPQVIPENIAAAVERSSYSLSVVTTVLSTMIIVVRILMVSRMPGASRQPRIAMEIVVESAVLYSISTVVYTAMLSPFTEASATYQLYPDIFFGYMADFAPALIMLRVALGQARQDAEWSGRTLSGIQFGNATPGVQESARTGGTSSTILTAPRSHYGKEVDLEASTRREEGRDGVNEVKASI